MPPRDARRSRGSRRWSARPACACSSRTRSASAACASCRSSSRRSTPTGSSTRRRSQAGRRRRRRARRSTRTTASASIAGRRSSLHGGADNVVDPRNAELLGELIPNARVEIVPDRGHLMVWEDSERVAELVTEFLRAVIDTIGRSRDRARNTPRPRRDRLRRPPRHLRRARRGRGALRARRSRRPGSRAATASRRSPATRPST